MPVINRPTEFYDEISAWRRDFHSHPELGYEEDRTSSIIAEKLKAFGCDEVVTGIAKTGVVGVIRGRSVASGRVVGMRADMDCLPLHEIGEVSHKSTIANRMHACGHDGHTSMLLGAAWYLCETRNFDGTAVVIFQPAEEGGAGGKRMVEEGIMERFGIHEVYGMHNLPGLPTGHFALRPGPLLAAADSFEIEIEGKGAHAARAFEGVDTVLVAAHMITALQSIVSRNVDALESGVVSVTSMEGGNTHNIIPQTVLLRGTIRALTPATHELIKKRFRELVMNSTKAFGASARIDLHDGYPVLINHEAETGYAEKAAIDVAGRNNVQPDFPAAMSSEDFSFMLNERPGAMIFVGNGDTAGLHHPAYDFNDEAIPAGVSFWTRLVEQRMPA